MRGAFSRFTFDPRKRYSAVLMQQGRVQLDADWNEQRQIDDHHDRAEGVDVIGRGGVPETGGGFHVDALPGVREDFMLSEGRLYAGGLLCELRAVPVPVSRIDAAGADLTLASLRLDDRPLAAGDWLRVSVPGDLTEPALSRVVTIDAEDRVVTVAPPATGFAGRRDAVARRVATYATQPLHPNAPGYTAVGGHVDLVYLDVWQRHVTALDDPEIREVALGGPDTTTRLQTVAQVRFAKDARTCAAIESLIPAESHARLTTLTVSPPPEEDLCLISPGGGYQGLENRLYRVEVHTGGNIDAASFKWSRDAGAVEYAVEEFPAAEADRVRLVSLGPDELLGLRKFDWLEVTDDADDLEPDPRPGVILQIADIDRAERLLTLSADLPAGRFSVDRRARVRRWDREGGADAVRIITGDAQELEDGISVSFSGQSFKSGDAWTFAARALTADIERLVAAPPQARQHHLVPLGTIRWGGPPGALVPEHRDCRPAFVGLVELLAQRVPRYGGGDGQEGRAGLFLDAPLVVSVEDGLGRPAFNVPVQFTREGGGALRPAAGGAETTDPLIVRTGADGLARAAWRLGTDPEVEQRVVATLATPPQGTAVAIAFTAQPHSLALRYLGGDGQEGAPGAILGQPLLVGVEDGRGRPVPGAIVDFEVRTGGGGVSAAAMGPYIPAGSATVDALTGVATMHWQLGAAPLVDQLVTATLRRGAQDLAAPLTFRASAREAQLLLSAVAGDGQEGEPGTELTCPIVIGVEDERGRPATTEVDLQTSGGGSLRDLSNPGNTGAAIQVKVASLGEVAWTLGPEPGCQRVTGALASAPQIEAQEAIWEAHAGPAGGGHPPYLALRHVSGDGQEGRPGELLPCALTVGVEDEFALPRPEVEVEFRGNNAVLFEVGDETNTGDTIVVKTNDEGLAAARWQLADGKERDECQRVQARIIGPPQDEALPVRFTAVATVAPRVIQVSWENDVPVDLNKFNDGLQVVFSAPIVTGSLSVSTFVVTVEVPWLDPASRAPGHVSHILAGSVEDLDERTTWIFRPEPKLTQDVVEGWINQEKELFDHGRVRVRVRLFGAAILGDGGHALDGESRFAREGDRTTLVLPSGDGREAGNFESWMWLES